MSLTSISAATRVSADLFASAAQSKVHGKTSVSTAIDDCGTVVPHQVPHNPPPPPPPFSTLAHFAGATLAQPTRMDDDWCGTVPHKLPPPPPPPWVDGINSMLGSR